MVTVKGSMCGRQGQRMICRHRKTLPPGWQVRHSQELADNSARLCGRLAGPSEANPVTLCQATVGYREKSSTLALHEIEDVNAKKEGQKQVR